RWPGRPRRPGLGRAPRPRRPLPRGSRCETPRSPPPAPGGGGLPVTPVRLATAADIPAVTAMILARCAWLEERGLPSWRENAEMVATQAESPHGKMWVLADCDGRIAGCTTIQDETPRWGWTQEELAEPAHYLYTSITDPVYQARRPGTVLALWAVDRAAR